MVVVAYLGWMEEGGRVQAGLNKKIPMLCHSLFSWILLDCTSIMSVTSIIVGYARQLLQDGGWLGEWVIIQTEIPATVITTVFQLPNALQMKSFLHWERKSSSSSTTQFNPKHHGPLPHVCSMY